MWPPTAPEQLRSRDWVSDCGAYHIWIQGRPRDSGLEYGAEVLGQKSPDGNPVYWLGDTFSLSSAKDACEEHKQGVLRAPRVSYGISGRRGDT